MKKVKRCGHCGCLFICNKFKYADCIDRSTCFCNKCYLKIHPNSSNICDITIIKSGFRKEDDISEES